MIESPVLIELLEDCERELYHRCILDNLEARFGTVPESLGAQVHAVQILNQLHELHREAVVCPDLNSFRARLVS